MFLNTLCFKFRETQTHPCPSFLRVAISAKPILLSSELKDNIRGELRRKSKDSLAFMKENREQLTGIVLKA